MGTYDIKLSLLRRRLLLALKHQKAYMDSMHIEYTGAEFEAHVRPSNPFDAGSIDMNAAAEFAEIRNPVAGHIVLAEDIEGSIDIGVNALDLLVLCPNVNIDCASGVILDDIYLTKPTEIGFDDIEAIVNVPGVVIAPDSAPVTSTIDATCDMAAKASFVNMPNIDYDGAEIVPDVSLTLSSVHIPPIAPNDIDIVTGIECAIGYISMPMLNMTDIGATMNVDCAMSSIEMPALQLTSVDMIQDVDASMSVVSSSSAKFCTPTNAVVGSDINIGLYVSSTLSNMNNATLESLEDMMLNEEYVLYGLSA